MFFLSMRKTDRSFRFPYHRRNAMYNRTGTVLIGRGPAFSRILELIDRVKDSSVPVFICGESGTGKELVARAIHDSGTRKNKQFIAVNCSAIPDHLLESELFGYIRGAFTGAVRSRPGLIEEAEGGTFFLDEIGDLSPRLQAKLLRLLQEKEIRRIGENYTRYIDVRFISATNRNIENEIKSKRFRDDLYYRLKIISIEIPPLRERRNEIINFLNHFIKIYSNSMNRTDIRFSSRALSLLMNYSWPGNVRELQNEVQRCMVLCNKENFISEKHLSSKIYQQKIIPGSCYSFFHARAEFEKSFIHEALIRCNFHRLKTAKDLGLSRQGLFKLIKKHDIEIPGQRKI